MALAAKLWVYGMARRLGLFGLAKRLTRRRLRVLAYHAFAQGEALQFRPKLFISPQRLERRLQMLAQRGMTVLPLDEAARRMQEGQDLSHCVVITIDDGFASTLQLAAPVLQRHGCAATVYITTYHVHTQTPVFDLVLAYLLWKTERTTLAWDWPADAGLRQLDLSTPKQRQVAAVRLLEHGHGLDGEAARVSLCQALGQALGVSYEQLCQAQTFRLMSESEIQQLQAFGVTVGLHTHRHQFPADNLALCRRELLENQAFLARVTGQRADHFCYPSGVYDPVQWPLLHELGVASATTCDTGLVQAGDSPYGWRRFLDGEMVSEIEFDAEICGFAELLRSLVGGRSAGAPHPKPSTPRTAAVPP